MYFSEAIKIIRDINIQFNKSIITSEERLNKILDILDKVDPDDFDLSIALTTKRLHNNMLSDFLTEKTEVKAAIQG
jgi:hypothetical protein